MKKISFLLFISIFWLNTNAQDTTTVTATSDDISEDLDLEAVASIFGESKDLEDFEKRLNNPDDKISNLDLNEDGEVDYLRVVDNSKGDTKTVAIQAVIGKDQFQDVAVIDVVKDEKGESTVQVVGDVYMYGDAYIVQPVYVAPPPVVIWWWGPYYHPWHSPFYWGYYPPFFRPWRVAARVHYRNHIRGYHRHSYHHTSVRISHNSVTINNNNRRNDYARKNPNNSFDKRNKGVSNKGGLDRSNRPSSSNNNNKSTNNRATTNNKKNYQSTGRKTNNNWQPSSRERTHTTPSTNNRQSRPSTRQSNPSTRQSTPSTRQSTPTRSYNRPSQSRQMSTPRVGGGRRR